MKTIFDKTLAISFQKVVKESVLEVLNGYGIAEFQMSLRDGMNKICCTIQKRLMEFIDSELVKDYSLRKDWVVERRNDAKTIISTFCEVNYERTYSKNKKTDKHARKLQIMSLFQVMEHLGLRLIMC